MITYVACLIVSFITFEIQRTLANRLFRNKTSNASLESENARNANIFKERVFILVCSLKLVSFCLLDDTPMEKKTFLLLETYNLSFTISLHLLMYKT